MHSGQKWTYKWNLKPDDEPQIITKTDEKQTEHLETGACPVSDDILSPAWAVGGVNAHQGGDRANSKPQCSFQTTVQ